MEIDVEVDLCGLGKAVLVTNGSLEQNVALCECLNKKATGITTFIAI